MERFYQQRWERPDVDRRSLNNYLSSQSTYMILVLGKVKVSTLPGLGYGWIGRAVIVAHLAHVALDHSLLWPKILVVFGDLVKEPADQ